MKIAIIQLLGHLMNLIRKEIIIHGMVQGVGFRYNCQKTARIYGVKGFVKNLPDGSVYVDCEGTENSINSFIKWCYNGPAHSRVENVEISDIAMPSNYSGFEIK